MIQYRKLFNYRAENKKMTVYDFDNTIYDGESGVDLFLYFLEKDPSLVAKIPWGLKILKDYKIAKLSMDDIANKYSPRIEEYGRTKIPDLAPVVDDFWNTHAYKIKSFYIKQRSDDDIIISACLDFVLAEICRRLGVKNFIASEVEYETKKLKRFCYKENKVKMFRERYPDEEIDSLYTDSFNDKPLMDISKNVFFVKGSKITQIKKDGVEVQ